MPATTRRRQNAAFAVGALVIQKLIFAAVHYAAFAIFAFACWGFGRAWLARIGAPPRRDLGLETAIAGTAGIGIVVCIFQLFAIFSLFRLPLVIAVIAIGIGLGAIHLPGWLRQLQSREAAPPLAWLDTLALAALALVALPALLAPLAPPAAYDELMYHLPYAREVAKSGSLAVVDWLRYPWFPYNFNLLYAGALMVGDDVQPHLLSALAGWLSVWIVYRLGALHASRVVGAVAAAIWIGVGDYASALIDTSVALFILSACAVLWWWRESEAAVEGPRWLALAAFLLGVAVGSKYQALTVMPLVAVFVIRRERRPWVWGLALLAFLIPCIYWYARNALQTGDPFNPIGGRLFGFTNWNLADYRNQIDDVQAHAAWPNAFLWGVLFAPFGLLWKRSAAVRAAGVFSIYSLAVWALTSRYPRYLFASTPLLALVSVAGWQFVFVWLHERLRDLLPRWSASGALDRAGRWIGVLLLAGGLGVSWQLTRTRASYIATNPVDRSAFLEARVPGYAVMNFLREHGGGRTYQVALMEAIYYGPTPVWGDAIGPWRYADFIVQGPAESARKLAGLGFTTLAVGAGSVPMLESQPGFADHFALLFEKDGAKAYRILAPQNEPKS